jgi:hypothetical protein
MAGALLIVLGLVQATNDLVPCSPARAPLIPHVEEKDGRKTVEGALRAGARDARWTFYWPTGLKKEESLWCSGVRHGQSTFWYETGLPELAGLFEHGSPKGRWTFWTPDGQRRVFEPRPARAAHDFFLDEGSRALVAHDTALASSLLRVALRNAPDDARVHRALGVLFAKTKDGAKAAFHYRRYIELAPDAKDRAQVEAFLADYQRRSALADATPRQEEPAPTAVVADAQVSTLALVLDRPARVTVDGRTVPPPAGALVGSSACVSFPSPSASLRASSSKVRVTHRSCSASTSSSTKPDRTIASRSSPVRACRRRAMSP